MKTNYQQIIEIDEDISKKFIPFRNRQSHWGDPSNRPLIPNVATIIPPDVDPDILPFLLYRMKLEELAYKTKYIDDQSINIVWTENKLDNYLFPNPEDALLSKAYECLRLDKHILLKEIDKAAPAVLPPQLLLSADSELPIVHPIKKNFPISPQNQEEEMQNQSADYDYSDDSGQLKESTSATNEQENENYDSPYENEYHPQQSSSKDENEKSNLDSYSYNPSFNSTISKELLELPKVPSYEEDHQRQQSLGYMDTIFSNKPPSIQPPKPNLPFQESYKPPPPPYPNSSYRYGPPNYSSSTKQQQAPPPPPPSFIQSYDRNKAIKVPPPPPFIPSKQSQPPPPLPQQSMPQPPRDFNPLPPPPPLIRNGPPQSNPNKQENGSGNQGSNQWNKFGNY